MTRTCTRTLLSHSFQLIQFSNSQTFTDGCEKCSNEEECGQHSCPRWSRLSALLENNGVKWYRNTNETGTTGTGPYSTLTLSIEVSTTKTGLARCEFSSFFLMLPPLSSVCSVKLNFGYMVVWDCSLLLKFSKAFFLTLDYKVNICTDIRPIFFVSRDLLLSTLSWKNNKFEFYLN